MRKGRANSKKIKKKETKLRAEIKNQETKEMLDDENRALTRIRIKEPRDKKQEEKVDTLSNLRIFFPQEDSQTLGCFVKAGGFKLYFTKCRNFSLYMFYVGKY